MAQSPNQFQQSAEKGMLDLKLNPAVISCQVDAGQATPLLPGDPVTIVDSAGGVPKVIKAAADTSNVFGFVAYDIKSQSFPAEARVEIAAMRNNVMYMEAGAAVARGAKVMCVVATSKVITATGTGKRVVGYALDKATADTQLIRVVVDLPGEVLA